MSSGYVGTIVPAGIRTFTMGDCHCFLRLNELGFVDHSLIVVIAFPERM